MTNQKKSIEYVSIEKLHFDPKNPRLPSTINKGSKAVVLDWMLKDATIIELMGAIGEHGYFQGEPLLVVPSKKRDGYDVVEGNRRLTAVKLLCNPSLALIRQKSVQRVSQEARHKPKELPMLKFKKRDEILDYLGYRHITGTKEWTPLAKARYLRELQERKSNVTFKELAKSIGSRADYVARLLAGLALYDEITENAFFNVSALSEETIRFSLLTTALNYSNITNFLGLKNGRDPSLTGIKKQRLGDLTTWLFEKNAEGRTRIGDSRNLKKLSVVVANEEALKDFRHGVSLDDAYNQTEAPTDVYRRAVQEAKSRLRFAQDHIYLVKNLTEGDLDILRNVQTLVRDLRVLVTQRLFESEDNF
jgi:hypothetical protein